MCGDHATLELGSQKMESSNRTRVLLHPMAILSMSDHYSRSKARGTDTVMGGFFGTYKDGVWEAIGSFGIPTIAAGSLQSTDMLLYVLLNLWLSNPYM